MFWSHSITSEAVDCTDFERIVAVAGQVLGPELALGDAVRVSVRLLAGGEPRAAHPAVDCRKICRNESPVGAVDRN